jgi:hypothetical protein
MLVRAIGGKAGAELKGEAPEDREVGTVDTFEASDN